MLTLTFFALCNTILYSFSIKMFLQQWEAETSKIETLMFHHFIILIHRVDNNGQGQ